jgi:ABC-type transport system involved in Fe-S cluster assembly fused permease/ATPase subunit
VTVVVCGVQVSQAALKSVSLDIFNHLHALSLRFHLNRQTGGILRAIERGTSSARYAYTPTQCVSGYTRP